MTANRCPGCPDGVKGTGKYLCWGCWTSLSTATRRLLYLRDRRARARLQELYSQLAKGVPLAEVEVSP